MSYHHMAGVILIISVLAMFFLIRKTEDVGKKTLEDYLSIIPDLSDKELAEQIQIHKGTMQNGGLGHTAFAGYLALTAERDARSLHAATS